MSVPAVQRLVRLTLRNSGRGSPIPRKIRSRADLRQTANRYSDRHMDLHKDPLLSVPPHGLIPINRITPIRGRIPHSDPRKDNMRRVLKGLCSLRNSSDPFLLQRIL